MRLGVKDQLKISATVVVFIAICACFCGFPDTVIPWSWRVNRREEGIIASTLPLQLKWTYKVKDAILYPPWYYEGIVYVNSHRYVHPIVDILGDALDTQIHALNADDGKTKWVFGGHNIGGRRDYPSEVVNSGNLIAFVHGMGNVTVLDTREGFVQWQLGPSVTYSLLADDRTLYVAVEGHVRAYDLMTGVRLWESEEHFPARMSMGLALDRGRLYVLGGKETWILDPATGRTEAILDIEPGSYFTIVSAGRIFVEEWHRDAPSWLVCYDAESGELLWRKPYWPGCLYWRGTIVGNMLLFRTNSGSLQAVDTDTGESVWEYKPPGEAEIISNVAILDSLVYVLASDKTLRALDIGTGKEIGMLKSASMWSWKDREPGLGLVISIPGVAASDDMLFVSFGGRTLYAFGP